MAEILTLVSLNYPLRTLLRILPPAPRFRFRFTQLLDGERRNIFSWTKFRGGRIEGESYSFQSSDGATNSVGRIGNETKQWRREINTRASIFHRGSLDSVVFLVITRRVPIPRLGDTQWNARRCRLTRVIQILPSGPAFRSSLSRCRADRAE